MTDLPRKGIIVRVGAATGAVGMTLTPVAPADVREVAMVNPQQRGAIEIRADAATRARLQQPANVVHQQDIQAAQASRAAHQARSALPSKGAVNAPVRHAEPSRQAEVMKSQLEVQEGMREHVLRQQEQEPPHHEPERHRSAPPPPPPPKPPERGIDR